MLAAEDAERAADRTSLERLHAILDSKQRAALADTWFARESVLDTAVAPKLVEELRLTADQQKLLGSTIDVAKKPVGEATVDKAKAAADEFKNESFAIDKVEPNDAASTTEARVSKLVDVVKDAAKIARPDQRALIAHVLRANAVTGRIAL